jgi:hypothetical protein
MRRNWQDGVEIVLEDLNSISSAMERMFYDKVIYELLNRSENAFFDDSFSVLYSGATSIVIKKGLGFQSDVGQTNPEPEKRPLLRLVDVNKSLNIPHATQDRIDIVVVKAVLVNDLSDTRKYKDAGSGTITNETVVTQKTWEAEISVVPGTPSGSPTPPATPTGYIKIAECYVFAVSGLSGQDDITDSRTIIPIGALTTIDTTGYDRLTDSVATPLSTLFSEIDGFIKNGKYEYCDIEEMDTAPGNPSADHRRVYFKEDGVLYQKDSSGAENQINLATLQYSQSITNNQSSPANVTGIIFDKVNYKGAQISFDIHRQTDSSNVQESGIIRITHDTADDLWRIEVSSSFDDAEVTFSITSAGQIQYISSNMAGASYSGTLRITNVVRFKQ